ncbi:mpv17-like protein 2 [Chelonus insularis]|uniref:mpv17-like protein 2 n=1 Tax=Chelonus insularis TaxID=460826 RepID=UPI00158A9652|nr:mpv17-like protein 2 [Chelonus insularis]
MNIARGFSSIINHAQVLKEFLFSPKCLLYTNIGISISLSATGDVLEQHYEILKGDIERWRLKRTCHMALSGMTVGIICHYWYQFLDARLPGKTISIVLKKTVIDQLVCSPLYIGMFFITLGILENKTWYELKKEIREKFYKLYLAEWIIWPPAQIINFYFLPTRFRVLYDNTISLGYDIYTSQVKHSPEVKHHDS